MHPSTVSPTIVIVCVLVTLMISSESSGATPAVSANSDLSSADNMMIRQDRNGPKFIRFGRSKGPQFIRFGRRYIAAVDEQDGDDNEADKYFGRPSRNGKPTFIRFG